MLDANARRLLAAVSLLWLGQAPAALAQTAGAEADAIVVTGRTPELTQRFVDQMSIAPSAADQLGRWDEEVCTSVVGLPARQGQFLADHIARRALALGLSPGAPGCHGNLAIFVAADAGAMARRMFEEDRSLFAYHQENNVNTLGQAAFDDFLNTSRPVRWWHVSQTIGADGNPLSGDASAGGMSNAPVARSSGSRLNSDTRQDFNRVIIFVDASRVGGVQLATLADYVAMVALAQIDPNADTSQFPTIMNLFAQRSAAGEAPTALTDWDIAFLNGLYSSTRHAASVQQQRRDIARRMQSNGGGEGSP